jgi:acetamidase/formamidase
VIHELPLERRTLHGHFSPDLPPVLSVDPGDSVEFATLDAGWGLEGGLWDRRKFEPRDRRLDRGHALVGPIEVRGASTGGTLAVTVEKLRVGDFGFTGAGGWRSFLNTRLGLDRGDMATVLWDIDADGGRATDQHGHTVELRPFLGVMGMPPPEPGVHSTGPPRIYGGNLDCGELGEGSTLFLPISVDGARFSAGDGHARQGDGEVSGMAIECPMEHVRLRLELRDDLFLRTPLARTADAWIVLGVDRDLDRAVAAAVDGMLDVMHREHGLERREALALASIVVDLRVTQMVNGVRGAHAMLRDDALR